MIKGLKYGVLLLFSLMTFQLCSQISAHAQFLELRKQTDQVLIQHLGLENFQNKIALDTQSLIVDHYGIEHYYHDKEPIDSSKNVVILFEYNILIHGKKVTYPIESFCFLTRSKKMQMHMLDSSDFFAFSHHIDSLLSGEQLDAIIKEHFNGKQKKLRMQFSYDYQDERDFPGLPFVFKIDIPSKRFLKRRMWHEKVGKAVWVHPLSGEILKVREEYITRAPRSVW